METGALGASVAKQFSTGTQVKVSLDLTASKLKDARFDPSAAPTNVKSGVVAPTLEVRQPLWQNQFGRSIDHSRNMAETQKQSAIEEENSEKRRLRMEADLAYYALSFSRDRVAIAERNLSSSVKLADFIGDRFKKNLTERSDLLQTQALVESRKLELQMARTDLKTASIRFNSLRHTGGETVPEVVDSLSTMAIAKQPDGLSSKSRPELKMLAEQKKSLEFAAKIEEEASLPELDVFAQYGLRSEADKISSAFSDIYDPARPRTTIGLRLSMMIDRDLAGSSFRAAHFRSLALTEQLQETEAVLDRELRSLIEKYESSITAYGISSELERLQKSRVENEQSEFKNGRSTTYSLLLATQDHAQAELGRLKSAFEIKTTEIQLLTFKEDQ
jgi:outer membrane protein TolC